SDHRLDRADRQARVGGEQPCLTCGAPARAAPRGEGEMREFRPPDAFVSPRFGGIPTFMRLPHSRELGAFEVALLGIPFDGGTSYRTGARFAPREIRAQSAMIRPYSHPQRVAPFEPL